jgi:hypothetical protein
MSTLTIRTPDDEPTRLRQLAKHLGIRVNKLIGASPKSRFHPNPGGKLVAIAKSR